MSEAIHGLHIPTTRDLGIIGSTQQIRREALADYSIKESFPHLVGDKDAYIKMFAEVVETTAIMIAKWMGVGFNHGVMNTDNMSIAGLTIDYGPYAFLDAYDFDYICNHTDQGGRYSFGNQPQIGHWNLSMLMNALSPHSSKNLLKRGLISTIQDSNTKQEAQKRDSKLCKKLTLSMF